MFPPRPLHDARRCLASKTGWQVSAGTPTRPEPAEEVAPEDADRVFYKLSPGRDRHHAGGPDWPQLRQ